MGYAVDMEIEGIVIPFSKVIPCLIAINALHTDEALLRHAEVVGYAISNIKQPIRVSHRYGHVENPSEDGFASLVDALAAWNYASTKKEDGSVEISEYVGEKWDYDELLFQTIAPFVENGGEIRVQGEDGKLWRYLFVGGKIRRQEGHIVYEDG